MSHTLSEIESRKIRFIILHALRPLRAPARYGLALKSLVNPRRVCRLCSTPLHYLHCTAGSSNTARHCIVKTEYFFSAEHSVTVALHNGRGGRCPVRQSGGAADRPAGPLRFRRAGPGPARLPSQSLPNYLEKVKQR